MSDQVDRPMLEVTGVSKVFGGVIANENVSMNVPEGKIIGLIGPNGSGKTTLFNSIVGYHPIDSGSVKFQTRVYGDMNCVKNMLISLPNKDESLLGMFAKFPPEAYDKAEQILEFVGLYSKRNLLAGELSFGQQKLLEFAMALMKEPKILLLDEPTAGINPTLINGIIDRLKRANDQLGITLFVIEHNMRVIMNLAEHIYCLAHGQLLADGPPELIQDNQLVIDAYLGAH